MHPIIKARAKQEFQIIFHIGYEDGDVLLSEPIDCRGKIFYHESRTSAKEGRVFDYSTSVHVGVDQLQGYATVAPKRVIINNTEYEVQGTSYVLYPFTQKLKELVIKL